MGKGKGQDKKEKPKNVVTCGIRDCFGTNICGLTVTTQKLLKKTSTDVCFSPFHPTMSTHGGVFSP